MLVLLEATCLSAFSVSSASMVVMSLKYKISHFFDYFHLFLFTVVFPFIFLSVIITSKTCLHPFEFSSHCDINLLLDVQKEGKQIFTLLFQTKW